jgi:sugar phosphate isomerase/epimerase
MRIGVVTSAFHGLDLDDALAHCARLGLDRIELTAGGFFPKRICDPAALLADPGALARYRERLDAAGIVPSALAVHGQPLHPDPDVARAYLADFEAACRVARELGTDRLTLLAGLPAAREGDRFPNWIVHPYPDENREALAWQWEARALPYWAERVELADTCDVRLCFELHPFDLVHAPAPLLRLRDALGDRVGANVDPSHLVWQGIEPREAILALGPAVYHAHAKDVGLNEDVARREGVLDPKAHGDHRARSWIFRTVGYGHDDGWWRDFVSTLRAVGYDDTLSIEHEDPLLDPLEGLERAVAFLRGVVPDLPARGLWYEEEVPG